MFVRMRWFTLGVIASVGVMAYVVSQLRRVRERMTLEKVLRETATAVATGLEAVARRVSPPDQ